MECKDCGEDIQVVRMMFSGAPGFFERVCFGCGWFDLKKYKTESDAIKGETA